VVLVEERTPRRAEDLPLQSFFLALRPVSQPTQTQTNSLFKDTNLALEEPPANLTKRK
jgi:hypothetical protein